MSVDTTSKVLAAGPAAGLVVPALARRGVWVWGLVRREAEAEAVRRSGASEIAVGDLSDHANIVAALKDIASVFYVAPAFIDKEVEVGKSMVEAVNQAGVRRFVV